MKYYRNEEEPPAEQRCAHCHDVKPTTEFNRAKKHGKNPFQRYCRSCQSESYAEWSKANRERKLAYTRKNRLDNLDARRAYDQARWKKPEMRLRRRAAIKRNYDRYRLLWRKYNTLRRCDGQFTPDDIERIRKAQKGRCAVCRKPLRRKYEIDHIKPVTKGGNSRPSNLQLLCLPCNRRKSNKDPIRFMEELGRLL
jgi:5-methylcytosine-specific restriction endonuclease McrA